MNTVCPNGPVKNSFKKRWVAFIYEIGVFWYVVFFDHSYYPKVENVTY